jgi:hypothetical protein
VNAPVTVRTVSYADPWELPVDFIRPAPEDYFRDVHAEETVLSHMLWKNKQSTRLRSEHFTSHDRKLIFEAIQSGAPCETIERLDLEMPAYVTDLFFAPANAPRFLVEAVDTLERLAELRKIRDRVNEWERKAPHLSVHRAKVLLMEALRECP